MFLKHFAGALLFYVAVVLAGSFILKAYTKHNKTIQVPTLTDKSVEEATKILAQLQLELKVNDSVYVEKKKANLVVDQNPKPNTSVKEMRTIYVTISTATPQKIKMPNLKDASFRQAQMVLESYGLKMGDTLYRHDIAKNAVLDQLIGAKPVKPGTMITKGTRVSLVLGDGLGEGEVTVPDLRGYTLDEAKGLLDGVGLSLGAVVTDNSFTGDTLKGFVYQQMPDAVDPLKNKIKGGETVDVFITNDVTRIPPELLDRKIDNELNENPK